MDLTKTMTIEVVTVYAAVAAGRPPYLTPQTAWPPEPGRVIMYGFEDKWGDLSGYALCSGCVAVDEVLAKRRRLVMDRYSGAPGSLRQIPLSSNGGWYCEECDQKGDRL